MKLQKLITIFTLLTHTLCAFETAEEITFENLAHNPWTDHVRNFQVLFETEQVDSMLELGIGYATKFFIDHCRDVTSIEILVRHIYQKNITWYDKCNSLFASNSNWKSFSYEFSEEVNHADLIAHEALDPTLFYPNYLTEIDKWIEELFSQKAYDLVFVDSGVVLRADFVNALFGRVDIIATHDTNTGAEVYGWGRLKSPEEYVKITCPAGEGTAFWVRKTKKDLIRKLKTRLGAL